MEMSYLITIFQREKVSTVENLKLSRLDLQLLHMIYERHLSQILIHPHHQLLDTQLYQQARMVLLRK